MNRTDQRKIHKGLLGFGIFIIQNQITYTSSQASVDYLKDRFEYFTKLSNELNVSEKAFVSPQDFILLYNIVSNYYAAYSSIFGDSADEEVQFYIASVAQLKDDLWEAKRHA